LVDSLIEEKQMYIKAKTEKEYTIPKLLENKDALINDLQIQNRISTAKIWTALLVILVVVLALGYYFRRQRIYKKRFETLMDQAGKSAHSTTIDPKSFGTNSTYLSKVVNIEKKKNFSKYINDLRIIYAFDELKTNTTFRKYTIKAIAQECGFKSAESFSKAFYKTYGIYPSFYIKKLSSALAKKLK
jgi:Helix-turn-helix domain